MNWIDVAIPVFAFSPLWMAALFVPGGGITQARCRLVKPQPIVGLICDMLTIDEGWAEGYHQWRHATGIVVALNYDGKVRSVEVDGSAITLSHADSFRLARAVAALKAARVKAGEDRAAILLASRAEAFALRAGQYAQSLVSDQRGL